MPFKWDAGTPVSAGKFDWDSGAQPADALPLPDLPTPRGVLPKVDPKKQPSEYQPSFWNDQWAKVTRLNPTPSSGRAHIEAYQRQAQAAQELNPVPFAAPIVPPGVMPEEESKLDVPLVDVPRPTGKGPLASVGRSVSKNVEMLGTPRNLGIAGGLLAVNAGAAAVPALVPVAQSANATAGTYFAAEMLGGLPQMQRIYAEKLAAGDTDAAVEAGTDMVITGLMAAGAGRGGAEAVKPGLANRLGVAEITAPKMRPHDYGAETSWSQNPTAGWWEPGQPVNMGVRPTTAAEAAPPLPPVISRQGGQAVSVGPLRPTPGKPMPRVRPDIPIRIEEIQDVLAKEVHQQPFAALTDAQKVEIATAARDAGVVKRVSDQIRQQLEEPGGIVRSQQWELRPLPPVIARAADGSAVPVNPLAPTPGRPMPGTPIGAVKARLQRQAKERAEIARQAQEALDAEQTPTPPNEAPWPVVKPAAESARVFMDDASVKPAAESAVAIQTELNRVRPNRDARRAAVEPPVEPGPTQAEQMRTAEAAQTQAARQKFAEEMTGKKWDELTNPEIVAVDELIAERRRAGESIPDVIEGIRRPSAQRMDTQGGFLRFGGKKPAPGSVEEIAYNYVEKREAARKGQEPSYLDRLRAVRDYFKFEMLDDKQVLADAVKEANPGTAKGNTHLSAYDRAQYVIDQSLGSDKIAEQFAKRHELRDTIRSVEDHILLDQYLIARHSLDLHRAGWKDKGRNLVDDQRIVNELGKRVAIPEYGGRPAQTYEQVAAKWPKMSNEMLDMAVESGLVKENVAKTLKEAYPNYIPINRVFTAVEEGRLSGNAGAKGVASISKQDVVQRLQGSSLDIDSPLESLIEQIGTRFQQIHRNNAARYLIDELEPAGMARQLKEGEKPASGKGIISAFKDGDKITYEVDPAIEVAAKNLSRERLPKLLEYASRPTRLLRFGATGASFVFGARNLFVDLAAGFNNSMFGPVKTARLQARSVIPALRNAFDGPIARELASQGGGFLSTDLIRNPARMSVEQIRSRHSAKDRINYSLKHPIKTAGDFFRAIEDVVGATESMGRVRMYESTKRGLIEEGWSPQEAAMKATVESNFAMPAYHRAGRAGRIMNLFIPYFNASIAGTRSWMRQARRDPKTFAIKVAMTHFIPVAAATLWNLADPERKRVHQDIRENEKERNIIMVLPGNQAGGEQGYKVLRFKMDPGLANAANIVRKFVESKYGNLPPQEWDEMAQDLIGVVSPVGSTKNEVISTLTPQFIKPTLQSAANFDFYRDMPIESPSMQRKLPQDRYYPWTSATARRIAPMVGSSPVKTEKFIVDTVGPVGLQFLNSADAALAAGGVIEPQEIGGVNPIQATVDAFTKSRGGQVEGNIYEIKAEIKRAYAEAWSENVKKTPEFKALPKEEQDRALRSIVSQSNSFVEDIESLDWYKELPADEKLNVLRDARAKVMNLIGRDQ